MNLLHDLTSYFLAVEEGIFGLLLWIAPDYIFNPGNGVLPFEAIVKTSMESNHLDKATEIGLAGVGACLLGLLYCRLFLAKIKAEKMVLDEIKFLGDLLILPLLIQNAFFDQSGMFNHQFFMVSCNAKILSILLQFATLKRSWKADEEEKAATQERSTVLVTTGTSVAAFVLFPYSVPLGIGLYLLPRLFAPGGALPYYIKTPLEDNTFDSLATWALRFEGGCLVAFLPLLWETRRTPHLAFQLAMFTCFLYTFVFQRGLMDKTGYADVDAFKAQLILHLSVMAIAWNLSKAKFGKKIPSSISVDSHGEKIPEDHHIPDLTSEGDHHHQHLKAN